MKIIFYLLILSIHAFASTLDELTEYALQQSSTIKQSQAQIALSKLKQQESRAQRYGELNLIGDYTHYNTARTLAPLTPTAVSAGVPITTSKDIYYGGANYAVALFTGFSQTRQIEISQIAKEMADVKMRLTKEQLVYNVRSLYLSILAQEEILQAKISYYKALSILRKQIAYEVKLGKKATIDLLKAKSNEQAAQTDVEVLKSSINITKATLSSLVGKQIEQLTPLKIDVTKPNYGVDSLYAKIKTLAKVQIEDMAVRKADKSIQKSKSSNLPQVHLSISAGKNYGEDLKIEEWDNETLWQAGVQAKWNILDFGKRNLSVQQAKIAKIDAILKKEQTLLDLRKLLTEAISKIEQNYAQYLGNVSQVALGEKSQKIEEVRYKNGISTLNDLLLAKSQTQLTQAKMIESRYNYQKSKYYLEYLLEKGAENEK